MTGLFRRLVDLALADELQSLDSVGLAAAVSELDPADLPDRLGELTSTWVARALADVPDEQGQAAAFELSARIMAAINATTDGEPVNSRDSLATPIRELTAIGALDPAGKVIPIRRPQIPIGDSVLLTNAPGEPTLMAEIEAEIDSADRIDLVLAFIRVSGIRKLIEPLRKHVAAGKKLRILTTTCTGSTEPRALDKLRELGAEIKVSYDTTSTRLHAKAWMFFRQSGQSTVYIGSSNLTHSAQIAGMEWNVRASESHNPDIVRSFESTFTSYWADQHFEPYDPAEFADAVKRSVSSDSDTIDLTPFDLGSEATQ